MAPKSKSIISLSDADRQKFLTKFKKKCSVDLNRLKEADQQFCFNHLLNLEALEAIDELRKELAENKRMDIALRGTVDSVAFIQQWYASWSTSCTIILSGVIGASAEYDAILERKAQQPVGVLSTILGFALVFLPEIKVLEIVFRKLVTTTKKIDIPKLSRQMRRKQLRDKIKAAQRGVEKQNEKVKTMADRINGGVQMLDRQSKEILDEAKALEAALEADENLEAASQEKINAHNAKNEVFKELLGNIVSKLTEVTNLTTELLDFALVNGSDPWAHAASTPINVKEEINDLIKKHNLVINPISQNTSYDKLSSIILYTMLKTYVNKYCSVTVYPKILPQSSNFEELDIGHPISGLDKSQLQAIYNRFSSKVWKDTFEYRAVNDIRDLIRYNWVKFIVSDNDGNEAYKANPGLYDTRY
jgi:hypothetical protein